MGAAHRRRASLASVMGRSRRNIQVEDDAAWIFNRMASAYDARPPYPTALVDSVVQVASRTGSRLLDIGAGLGHLALPLAERGLEVTAVEPARQMLDRLRLEASRRNVNVRCFHAAAEALPFEEAAFDGALIADALHFLDAELVAKQLRRVLVPRGALVIVTCGLTPTPFIREVQKCVDGITDRRRRDTSQAIRHLASLTGVRLIEDRMLQDETPVDGPSLERILQSVSFIGPAMNGPRFETLRERIATIPYPAVWARTFNVRYGFRKRRSGPLAS